MHARKYHADPCPDPSLSKGSALLICSRSPRHAFYAHPRLNPSRPTGDAAKFDVGTAVHALLLERKDVVVVIDASDWRTTSARDRRDAARKAGRIPLLPKEATGVADVVRAVREQLADRNDDPPLLTKGKPERTVIWRESDVWCRARPDWLRDDLRAIDDLKTTAGSADPSQWAHARLFDIGADLQSVMYRRGVQRITGKRPKFRLIVIETAPPYGLSVLTLAPSAEELAERKLDYALRTFRDCLRSGRWPGYSNEIASVELPYWRETDWLERTFDPNAEPMGAAA